MSEGTITGKLMHLSGWQHLTHPRDDYLIIHIGERRVVPPLASTIEEDELLIYNTKLHKCDA